MPKYLTEYFVFCLAHFLLENLKIEIGGLDYGIY